MPPLSDPAIREKRRHPRVNASVKVRYRVLRAVDMSFTDDEAVSRDMGLGGLALALGAGAASGLGKDDMVKLEILEGQAKGLRAYAEVAWASDEKAGLRFMGILDDDLERLRGVVQLGLLGNF
jgi:hypothetical protein